MNPRYMIIVLTLAAIVYGAFWSSLGTDAKRQTITTLENLRDKGMTVEYSAPTLGGFPYRMEITLENLSIKAPAQGFMVDAKNVVLIGHPWKPNHWFLQTGTIKTNLLKGGLTFRSADTITSLRLDQNDMLNISLDLSNATFNGRLTMGNDLKGDTTEIHLKIPQTFTNTSDGLMEETRFNGTIRVANLKHNNIGLAHGTLDFSWQGKGPTKWNENALAAWRDAGGVLDVSRLSLLWGNSELLADMDVSLDESFYPLGAGSLKIKGDILDQLKSVGVLKYLPDNTQGDLFLTAQFGTLSINGTEVVSLPQIKP